LTPSVSGNRRAALQHALADEREVGLAVLPERDELAVVDPVRSQVGELR
jgi:hypothetical protein